MLRSAFSVLYSILIFKNNNETFQTLMLLTARSMSQFVWNRHMSDMFTANVHIVDSIISLSVKSMEI